MTVIIFNFCPGIIMQNLLIHTLKLERVSTKNIAGTQKKTRETVGEFPCRLDFEKKTVYDQQSGRVNIVRQYRVLYLSADCPVEKWDLATVEGKTYEIIDAVPYYWASGVHHLECELEKWK